MVLTPRADAFRPQVGETAAADLAWIRDALSLDVCRPGDRLADLGLTSIRAAGLSAALVAGGHPVSVREVLRCATVADLCALATSKRAAAQVAPAAVGGERALATAPFPFTLTQRFWQAAGCLTHYNVCGCWRFDLDAPPGAPGALDLTVMERAIALAWRTTPELRLRIHWGEAGLRQRYADASAAPMIERLRPGAADPVARVHEAQLHQADLQHEFRFDEAEPLVRFVAAMPVEQGKGWFFVLAHHYLADGFGFRNLLNRLSAAYRAVGSEEEGGMPAPAHTGRDWALRMERYVTEEAHAELPIWSALPWRDIAPLTTDADVRGARLAPPPDLFDEEKAARLHAIRGTASGPSEPGLYRSQALAVARLDAKATILLLERRWPDRRIIDFDLVTAAVAEALAPRARGAVLWVDGVSSGRTGVFDEIDAAGCIGYTAELCPQAVPFRPVGSVAGTLAAAAAARAALPRGGVGFRALKAAAAREGAGHALAAAHGWPDPEVGINYRAPLQYGLTRGLLNLEPVSHWLGEEMDERGVPYLLWYRISFSRDELDIALRYSPVHFDHASGVSIVTATRDALARMIRQLAGTGAKP